MLLAKIKAAITRAPNKDLIDGVPIREIEKRLRKLGYTRPEALKFIHDLKEVLKNNN